ncbi:Clp family protein, partial [Streptomyces sp. NBRC 110611]
MPAAARSTSPWRSLGCFKQALLVLAHLRKNETFAQVGAGFGVSEAAAWRYVDETLQILAAWAPGLREALVGLGEGDFVIVDGTLIPTDRIAPDEPYYSQKHKRHGMNVQVVTAPDGTPLWFSRATPGRTHDLTAARAHGIVQACPTRQILVLADRAYQGASSTVRTPYEGATTNCPTTTSSTTVTTPDSAHPANAPSPDSSSGRSSV